MPSSAPRSPQPDSVRQLDVYLGRRRRIRIVSLTLRFERGFARENPSSNVVGALEAAVAFGVVSAAAQRRGDLEPTVLSRR